MKIHELRIQLDLYPENKIDILEDVASECNEGYLFVDSLDGYCYLFDENGNEDDIKKVKKIEIGAFCSCENLKSIIIPNSVKEIEDSAFYGCDNLELIVIPNSIKIIRQNAFKLCENLKSIEIPDSVESIGVRAFGYCKSLKSIIFKGKTMEQVKEMKYYPFGIVDESIIRCC